ncbi:MAG: BACON domain-containing protein, partial [Bacteroidales bacterium]|nr:BACON domain-containing protein [Bacteroidales bacterium]
MKNKNITNFGRTALIVLPLFLLSLFLLYSCKEDPVQEDPFFSLEGSPTGLTLTKAAKTTSYVVRSNRPWEVVKKSGADWLKVFPEKGDA